MLFLLNNQIKCINLIGPTLINNNYSTFFNKKASIPNNKWLFKKHWIIQQVLSKHFLMSLLRLSSSPSFEKGSVLPEQASGLFRYKRMREEKGSESVSGWGKCKRRKVCEQTLRNMREVNGGENGELVINMVIM